MGIGHLLSPVMRHASSAADSDITRNIIYPKAPAPGWAVDSYKMVIVNKRESMFLDIKYS